MAKSFVDLVRSSLRDGANFLGAAECSPIMADVAAPIIDNNGLENWGIALENMYHALLCLLSAQSSLHASAPVKPSDLLGPSQRLGGGTLLRQVLDGFATGQDYRRLAIMSSASRIALIAVLLDELRAVYRALAYDQQDWVVDPDSMRELNNSLQAISLSIGRGRTTSRLRFTPAPRRGEASSL
ncbi:hypothetical protein [uncultured Ferrovibrio sp.]|jgi:hypothetical protein|uniref:hypothetical protein n=1 Tax=uncultured Ferrovibrio sp. TaxID=1576913 RepID=UPI00261C58A1|nr:hypothetical protein [uncultured Ferrovibrio sp.]